MSYTIVYNSETHSIETKVRGDLFFSEVKELMTDVALVVKEKGCFSLLSDYREAAIKLSTMQIYELPKILLSTYESLGLNARLLRRALVASKQAGDFQFFEAVTANNGQNAKVFYDIDEAKNWLYKK